jgi:hypothetical protein
MGERKSEEGKEVVVVGGVKSRIYEVDVKGFLSKNNRTY